MPLTLTHFYESILHVIRDFINYFVLELTESKSKEYNSITKTDDQNSNKSLKITFQSTYCF